FNDTATTEIYTLSLHDALPISQLLADFRRQHPPFFFPGAHAAIGPDVGVVVHGVVDRAGHRAQRVADHVGRAFQDGELWAIAEQRVSHAEIVMRRGRLRERR